MPQTSFSLQFLGTGNARSKPPANFNTCALVRTASHCWLIDCGFLCPLAMAHFGIPMDSVEGVFISHLHGDHVQGLEEFFFSSFFCPAPRRPDLFLPCGLRTASGAPEGYDLWENCLRASLETTVQFGQDTRLLGLDDYATSHTLYPGRPFPIYGLTCETFPVEHVQDRPAFGLILDGRVAYTSDCTFSRDRLDVLFSRGITTVFHDCCFTENCPKARAVHAPFDLLATLPPDYASRIVLMHYSDKTSPDQILQAENLGFRVARPGMVFDF